jgi:hypothetical protein
MTATNTSKTTATSAAIEHVDAIDTILRRLATQAMGLTGANIERIVREARLKARRGKRAIRYEDIEEAIGRPCLIISAGAGHSMKQGIRLSIMLSISDLFAASISIPGRAATISSASKYAGYAHGGAGCRAIDEQADLERFGWRRR